MGLNELLSIIFDNTEYIPIAIGFFAITYLIDKLILLYNRRNKQLYNIQKKAFKKLQIHLYQLVSPLSIKKLSMKKIKKVHKKINKLIKKNSKYCNPNLNVLLIRLEDSYKNKKKSKQILEKIQVQIIDEYYNQRKFLGYSTINLFTTYNYLLSTTRQLILWWLFALIVPLIFLLILIFLILFKINSDALIFQIFALLFGITTYIFLGISTGNILYIILVLIRKLIQKIWK